MSRFSDSFFENRDEVESAIGRASQEAIQLAQLAFASYAPQLAVAVAVLAGHPAVPTWLAVLLVALAIASDGLTLIFAMATLARHEFGSYLIRTWRPWPRMKEYVDRNPKAPEAGYLRWWYSIEESVSDPANAGNPHRILAGSGSSRPWFAVLGLAVLLLGTTGVFVWGVA